MRLFSSIAVASLSGLAFGASPQSADVFVFESKQQSSLDQPRLPKEVARHILLQRTSTSRYGSDLRDIPNTIDVETTVDYIARFGKSPAPLFAQSDQRDPSQLVVILEGVSATVASQLKETLAQSGQYAAFAVSDPPSAAANNRLMTHFRNLGIASQSQCDMAAAINPFDRNCWSRSSSVVKYDALKSPNTVQNFVDALPRLNKFIIDRDLEVVLVLMPESSRASKLDHWSTAAAGSPAGTDLRRRGAGSETVIADDSIVAPTKAALSRGGGAGAQRAKSIPHCFNSFNTCMEQTGNCSSHGECANKYVEGDKATCFSCLCKATIVRNKDDPGSRGLKTAHWGGKTCQKQDISIPFWLITGFTVTIIGAIGFAIGLLYSVGEEKLPGVIGAGVSRSK